MSHDTILRAALCISLVSQHEQDCLATQPGYCGRNIPLSTASINYTTSQDEVQFPAVTLFQNPGWSSQATLHPKLRKCFLGWHWLQRDTASCDDLRPEQIAQGKSCDCNNGWTNHVIDDFEWQGTTYRYVSWRPDPKLIDRIPTYRLTLQAFFTCISARSTSLPFVFLFLTNLQDCGSRGLMRLQITPLKPNSTPPRRSHLLFGSLSTIPS